MAEDTSKTIGTISIFLAALNGLILVVSSCFSLYLRQNFTGTYHDFEASLPVLTTLLISTPLIVWLVVTMVLLIALILKEFITPKQIPLYLNLLFLLLVVAYWLFFSISIVLPLFDIGQKLSN